MLGRALDDTYAPEVRANITLVTVARLTANSAYRFLVPFLAVVADGFDISVAKIGVALTIGELAGLSGTFIGRAVHRLSRRRTLVGGLATLAAGAAVVGAAPNLAVFTAGLVAIALSKIVFDIALLSWISDHVPLARRGRVIGITEMAWAASLFIGVTLMGVITAIWSWRWAYGTAAAAIVVLALLVLRRLPHDTVRRPTGDRPPPSARLRRRPSMWIVAVGLMLLSGQLLFVVLGPWLKHEHGFSAGGVSVVAFGIGACELVASTYAIRLTDRWGGRRSMTRGGLLIVPAAIAFAAGQRSLVIGLLALGVGVLGFEFAIVSAVSVATTLVPGSPAAGIGLMVTAGTLGRATGSATGTWLYDQHGAVAPAVLSAVVATAMVVLSSRNVGGQQPTSPGTIGRTASTNF